VKAARRRRRCGIATGLLARWRYRQRSALPAESAPPRHDRLHPKVRMPTPSPRRPRNSSSRSSSKGTSSEGRSPKRNSSKGEQTRKAILAAAGKLFAARGYDACGVRDIGDAVGVNPALINLYFGSKEGLFREVLHAALDGGPLLDGDRASLGRQWAEFTVRGIASRRQRLQTSNQSMQLLIRSASSPVAAKAVREAIDEWIVQPIAAHLQGPDAPARAALITTYLLGFALMQRIMRIDALVDGDPATLIEHLASATQDCVDGAAGSTRAKR
jgi:AcrR family transcriptional regulator